MPIDIAALKGNIERETGALHAFTELLRAEQSALINGESERVAEFAEAKAARVFELTRFGEERGRWLKSLGLNNDRAGMERLLREHARNDSATVSAWQQLLKLSESAQQTNTTNGMLINARLQHTQRALNVIFSSARLPGAYGADGNTVSLRTGQQLAVV